MKRAYAAALTAFFILTLSTSAMAKGQAVVLSSSGKVDYRESVSGEWKPLGRRTHLKEGSFLQTGPESTCEVGFVEGSHSVIRVGADSQAAIVTANPARIDLQSGRILSLVKNLKKNSTFIVSTPTAIASVRGTGWTQTPGELTVFDDTVHVAGINGEEEDVKEGTGILIEDSGDLGDPIPVTQEALDEWNSFKQEASGKLGDHLNDVLSDIDENDPTEDLFESKNAFEESSLQEALNEKVQETKAVEVEPDDNQEQILIEN